MVRCPPGGENGRRPAGETDRTPFRPSPRNVGSGAPLILRRMVYWPPVEDLLRRAFLNELSESLSFVATGGAGAVRGDTAEAAAEVESGAGGMCFFCRAARG